MTDDTATITTAPRPYVRAGSVAWGLILIAAASLVLWVTGDDARREAVAEWTRTLTPGTAVVVAVLVLGGILLLAGVLAAIRRVQRRAD